MSNTKPTPAAGSGEPTIDWLIDAICPNPGNSPLLNFNKKRLRDLITAQNNATYEAVMKAINILQGDLEAKDQELDMDGRPTTPAYRIIDGDAEVALIDSSLAELRQNIAKIFGKEAR